MEIYAKEFRGIEYFKSKYFTGLKYEFSLFVSKLCVKKINAINFN